VGSCWVGVAEGLVYTMTGIPGMQSMFKMLALPCFLEALFKEITNSMSLMPSEFSVCKTT